jgi:hypothetical protein
VEKEEEEGKSKLGVEIPLSCREEGVDSAAPY